MQKAKIFSVLLALLLVCTGVGCEKGGHPDITTNGQPETEPDGVFDKTAVLPASALSNASILCGEIGDSLAMRELVLTLRGALEEKTGFSPDILEDGTAAKTTARIVIGAVDSEDSWRLQAELRSDDWGYGMIGAVLYITAGSQGNIAKALDRFIEALEKGGGAAGTVFDGKNSVLERGSYTVRGAWLNGTSVAQWRIVYPSANRNREREVAELLSEHLSERIAYMPTIATDSSTVSSHEILIGNTNRALTGLTVPNPVGDGFGLVGDAARVVLCATDVVGLVDAALTLTGRFGSSDGGLHYIADIRENGISDTSALIRVLSYNIYNESGGINLDTRPYREQMVVEQVKELRPDVFLCQEPRDWWMIYLMQKLGDEYTWSYTPSNGKDSDESNMAIFYRPEKLKLLDNGMFWLSATPDRYSQYPGSWCPRILTWAKFEERATGKCFLAINVHLDGSEQKIGGTSINTLHGKQLAEFMKKNRELPMLAAGDFNRGRTDSAGEVTPYQLLTGERWISEADETAWRITGGKASIDFTFVTPDKISVVDFRFLIGKWMEHPTLGHIEASDHYPQYTAFYLK